jgi:hypothetical protein
MMNQKTLLFALLCVVALPFCSTSKKTLREKNQTEPRISYVTDIAPIFAEHCTPCHFPGGKKKFLDTYAAVSENIDDIIYRVELPVDADGFMPFKSKNDPLSESQIHTLKVWVSQKMPN